MHQRLRHTDLSWHWLVAATPLPGKSCTREAAQPQTWVSTNGLLHMNPDTSQQKDALSKGSTSVLEIVFFDKALSLRQEEVTRILELSKEQICFVMTLVSKNYRMNTWVFHTLYFHVQGRNPKLQVKLRKEGEECRGVHGGLPYIWKHFFQSQNKIQQIRP